MKNKRVVSAALLIICLIAAVFSLVPGAAGPGAVPAQAGENRSLSFLSGGGYAASGQISGVGYTTTLYDATNGLPTSDAMCLLGDSDGYVWIGGYSGVIRYDGTKEKVVRFTHEDELNDMLNAFRKYTTIPVGKP